MVLLREVVIAPRIDEALPSRVVLGPAVGEALAELTYRCGKQEDDVVEV